MAGARQVVTRLKSPGRTRSDDYSVAMPDSVVPDSSRGATRNLRDLVDPVVVVAFGGWNDAGDAATACSDGEPC